MRNVDNVAQTGFVILSIIVSLIFKATSSVIETDLNISSADYSFKECVTKKQCPAGYYCQQSSYTCEVGSYYGQLCNSTEECLDPRTYCSADKECDCGRNFKYLYKECRHHQYCLYNKDCTDGEKCYDRKCEAYQPKTEPGTSLPLSNVYVAAMISIGCAMFVLSCCIGIMIYIRKRAGDTDDEESIIPNSSSRTQVNPFTFDNEPDFSQLTPSPEYDPPPPYDASFMRTPLSLPPYSVVAPGSSTETTTTDNGTLAPQTVAVVSTDANHQVPQSIGSVTSTLLTTIN